MIEWTVIALWLEHHAWDAMRTALTKCIAQ
jgi:hypothetical protein